MPDEYSLKELEELSGIESRTIRSYIEQGLLPGPLNLGRNARYGERHLSRLRAIWELRYRQRHSMAEVRAALLSLPESRLEALGGEGEAHADTRLKAERRSSEADPAAEYFARRKEEMGGSWTGPGGTGRTAGLRYSREAHMDQDALYPASELSLTRQEGGQVERLARQLEGLKGSTRQTRRASTSGWVRFQVTPDIEIHVREELAAAEFAAVRRIAETMRDLLAGEAPAGSESDEQ